LVNFHLFSRVDLSSTSDLREVKELSDSVFEILNKKSIVEAITDAHVFGASSHSIQKAILPEMLELGFTSEKNYFSLTTKLEDCVLITISRYQKVEFCLR